MLPFLLTIDHIYPVAKRGTFKNQYHKKAVFMRTLKKEKCVLACKDCNLLKGDRVISIEAFRKEQMGWLYFPVELSSKIKKECAKTEAHIEKKSKIVFAKNIVYPKEVVVLNRKPRFWFAYLKSLWYNMVGCAKG